MPFLHSGLHSDLFAYPCRNICNVTQLTILVARFPAPWVFSHFLTVRKRYRISLCKSVYVRRHFENCWKNFLWNFIMRICNTFRYYIPILLKLQKSVLHITRKSTGQFLVAYLVSIRIAFLCRKTKLLTSLILHHMEMRDVFTLRT
jgi:hypothetical protein